jgi:PAS domain S-box-containing protein
MQRGRDRDLLEEWLASVAHYSVEAHDPGAAVADTDDYDLYLVDAAGFRQSRRALRGGDEPAFRPCLFVTPETTLNGGIPQSVGGESATALINDIVTLPVEQAVLQGRIDNLLQAKHVFDRLQEREQQYEQLVELAPEAILVVKEETVVYSNTAARQLFADGDSLDGREVWALVPDDEMAAMEACLEEIAADNRTEAFHTMSLRTEASERITAEVAGTHITVDDDLATQLLVRDVTAEHERKQNLTLFERAIQTAVEGITIADARQPDAPLVYANNAFEQITGYSTAEVMGRNCRFLQGEGTDSDTVARMRHAVDNEEPVSVEILNYRKDGTPFWSQITITPVTDGSGTVTHFLGLQRDITDQRARIERLQVLGRVLRHNLRNRMNVIIGHAERLQATADGETADTGEAIADSARSLLTISERINEFSSVIDENKREHRPCDVAAVLDRIADGLRTTYPAATIRLDSPETVRACGDALLPAALEEFLELALDDTAGPPDIEVVVTSEADWVTVALHDHGRTIAPSDLASLRKERETATEHPQGIGLWIVRWAVLYSDGELTVDEDGDDVCVRIRLHAADEASA